MKFNEVACATAIFNEVFTEVMGILKPLFINILNVPQRY
jgi:hypothetical protein